MKTNGCKFLVNFILCILLGGLFFINKVICLLISGFLLLLKIYLCIKESESKSQDSEAEGKEPDGQIKYGETFKDKIKLCIKFPVVIELINIVVINALLISINNENDKITFVNFELLKTNTVYLVNFIIFISVWESLWKNSFFGFLEKMDEQIKCDSVEKKYLELSLDDQKKQLDYFFISVSIVSIIFIFFMDFKGLIFNNDILAIIGLIDLFFVLILKSTIIYLKLDSLKKDSFWSLNVWNYLIYKDEMRERLKGNHLTNRDLFFRNRESITIKDIATVRKSIKKLDENQLINLIYFESTPYYFNDFSFSFKSVKKIIFSVFTVIVGKNAFYTIFEWKNKILEISSVNFEDWILIVNFVVAFICIFFLISSFYHLLLCTQKKKQVDFLLIILLQDEYTRRDLKVLNTKTSSKIPKNKLPWKIFKSE